MPHVTHYLNECPKCKTINTCRCASPTKITTRDLCEYCKKKSKSYSGKDAYPIYQRIIEPIRERAKELGYAIGVHGTLKRDIDLIACPWTNIAVDAQTLAEEIRKVAESIHGIAFMLPEEQDQFHLQGCPGMKPHGRLVWTFHFGGGPYIDLSVIPRKTRK